MQTILCPVDFSECSENAAKYAAAMAKEFNSSLILLHVYESPERFTDESVLVIEEIDKSIKRNAGKNLLKMKTEIVSANPALRITNILAEGDIAINITETAEKEMADIIVMGTGGKGRSQRLLIGSASSKVINHADCPVLCIPTDVKYKTIKKIVFATDLKTDNILAASCIVNFAKHFDAEIIFVLVDGTSLLNYNQFVSDMKNKIKQRVHYNKISGYVVDSKTVASGLEGFLKSNPADALVMFTHHRHAPELWIHPGITKDMLHDINIPLLALSNCEKHLV